MVLTVSPLSSFQSDPSFAVAVWFFKKYQFFVSSHDPMQKSLSLMPRKQNFAHRFSLFHLSLSFNWSGTHFPAFWNFPMAYRRSEMVFWPTFNISAICCRVCAASSFNNACNSESSILSVHLGVLCLSIRTHHFWESKPTHASLLRWDIFILSFHKYTMVSTRVFLLIEQEKKSVPRMLFICLRTRNVYHTEKIRC